VKAVPFAREKKSDPVARGKRFFREGNARFLGAFRNFARSSRLATLGPLITPERTRILRKRSPVIWVDRVGRNPIIGCAGKIGKFVRFSKLYGSCVTEGLCDLDAAGHVGSVCEEGESGMEVVEGVRRIAEEEARVCRGRSDRAYELEEWDVPDHEDRFHDG